jgi:hypothetical protein
VFCGPSTAVVALGFASKMPSRDSQNVIVSLYLFYKTITKWFSKQDSVIHALGMLLDFRKA